ncbi:MAG: hypothetical protein WCD70_08990 [Alphaproteobacteria bacterium]
MIGKPSSGVAIFAALLWTYDLLDQLDAIAAPARHERGQKLALSSERKPPHTQESSERWFLKHQTANATSISRLPCNFFKDRGKKQVN